MITLIVPTMNRSDFLIRQLHYYRDLGFKGCIAIGDSSNAEHLKRTKKALESFQGNPNIVFREYPGLNDAEVLKRLLEFVVTPYAAFVADDDFLVPGAIEQCEIFLDSHPDYSAAHGTGLALALKSSGPYGEVTWVRTYEQAIIEAESAAQRLIDHMSNYQVPLFSVHRIESWREMYKDISMIADKTFASELLPCCLDVILGKIKELDCLYLMRQDHPERYILPGKYDWIKNSKWPDLCQVFVKLLSRELAAKDGIGLDEAEEIIKRAFDSYMVNLLGKYWQDYSGQGNAGIQNRMRVLARKVPGLLQVWSALHSSKSVGKKETSMLADLMNPSSRYHSDFMPIYRAITAENGVRPD